MSEEEESRLARLARAHRTGRWILIAFGIAAPLGLHALFERQARRLDALADQGRAAVATVTAVDRDGDSGNVAYEYEVQGRSYSWSVRATDAPSRPGQTFPIRYLPEDPSFSRPGEEPARATREAASNRRFARKVVLGVLIFFGLNLLLQELKARKLRRNERFVISARGAGRLLALALIGCALVADNSPEVRVVFVKAFGAAPWGVPVVALVSSVNVLLLLPYFWVCEHLMRIVFQAVADRASISRSGLVIAILFAHRAHPELVRSRRIVLLGLACFVALIGIWIAFAESRGL